jgi:hypothetical protein
MDLEQQWRERMAWAREQAQLLYPSDHLPALIGNQDKYRPAVRRLIEQRTQAFLELAAGAKLPPYSQAGSLLPVEQQLLHVPIIARAIWTISRDSNNEHQR